MRTIFPSLVCIATFQIACVFTSAQTPTDISNHDLAIGSIYMPGVSPVSGNKIFSRIHIKAVRYFLTAYPAVYNETWEVFKGGYVVKFVNSGIETKNYFDKRGNWLNSIKRYDESKLPKRIRAEIKSIYFDYAITQIQEINTGNSYGERVYLIYMQFDTTFKIIRFCNDEIDEIHY